MCLVFEWRRAKRGVGWSGVEWGGGKARATHIKFDHLPTSFVFIVLSGGTDYFSFFFRLHIQIDANHTLI